MISLKTTFDGILAKWGHNVMIQRLCDPKTMEYSSRLQRYTTRSIYPGSQAFANLLQEKPQGLTVSSEIIYYFQDSVNPKSGDRVYEDMPGTLPDEIYNIDFAAPVKGKGGKIVYWVAGATRESTK